MSEMPANESSRIKVEDLATLVAGFSRFLTRLSKLEPFQDAGLGLAEWSALSIIADKSGINSRQLANFLGVSAQRINQLAESLKGSGFITLSPAPDDARKKIIDITPSGAARLKELNDRLLPILSAALGKREKTLVRANRLINRVLMRVVLHSNPAKQKRSERQAARAAAK
jgi:DNA-binding MarR family transcriptional regulator